MSKEERAEASRIISESEDRRERNLGRQAVTNIQTQLGQELPADVQKAIVREAVQRDGRVDFNVVSYKQTPQQFYSSIPQPSPQPQKNLFQRGVERYFGVQYEQTPFALLSKAKKDIQYGIQPTVEQIRRDQFSQNIKTGLATVRSKATSTGNQVGAAVSEFVQPTSEREKLLLKQINNPNFRYEANPRLALEIERQRKQDVGLGLGALGAGFASGLARSPFSAVSFTTGLVTSPRKEIKDTVRGIKEIPQKFRQSPFTTIGELSGEAVGQSIFFKGISKVTRGGAAEFSREFKPIETVGGKQVITKLDQPIAIAPPVSQILEPLSTQAKLAGKPLKQSVSAGANFFETYVRGEEKVIFKPDAIGIEQSFFLDPRNRLRVSRFGGSGNINSLSEVLEADVAFGARKNLQAIVVKDQLVEKFPTNLADVKKNLLEGKSLTLEQQKRLLKWQLTPSGQFKPIGKISKESEVTVAPGDSLFFEQRLGVSTFRGEPFDIIEARLKQSGEANKPLLKALEQVKTQAELENFVNSISSVPKKSITISPSGVLLGSLSISSALYNPGSVFGLSGNKSSSGKSNSINSASASGRVTELTRPSIFFKLTNEPSKVTGSGISGKASYRKAEIGLGGGPRKRPRKGDEDLRKKNEEEGAWSLPFGESMLLRKAYDVYVKRSGKYRKIADNLNRNRAEKFGAEYVLKTLASRFKLVEDPQAKPKFKTDINYEPDSAIFRNYQIKKNRQVPLKDEWIEFAGTKKEPTSRFGARLGSGNEVSEILGFKRAANRNVFGFKSRKRRTFGL